MKEATIALPRLALIAATRGMLGVGIGLLLSEKLARGRRTSVGWALVAIGGLSTIPLMLGVAKRVRRPEATNGHTLNKNGGEGLPAD
ncbi:MAG: hypothetical protein ACM31C_16730 [Acidobacteriota bacterium]